MKSSLENFLELRDKSKVPLHIGSSLASEFVDHIFSEEDSQSQKCESYFSSGFDFYVKETQPMELVAKIQKAKKAFVKIENWPSQDIVDRFKKIRSIVASNQNAIAAIEAQYQGTTRVFQLRWSVQPLLKLLDHLIEQSGRIDLSAPKGLIGAITPKSQSFFEIGWRILYGLFHKDSLVIKPATEGSLSAIIWQQILQDCDLPEGLVAFVYGPGPSVGRFLLDHPGVKHLSFSGSYESLKSFPVSLEKKPQFFFNGKNSICVLPDFNFSKDMVDLVKIFVEHNGKSVFSPSRIFVVDSFEKDFKVALAEQLKQVSILKSIDDDFGFLPLKKSEKQKLAQVKEKFLAEDAKIVFENENFLFFTELPNCSEWHQENIELPIYNLTSVKYTHEMVRWVNNNSYGHSLIVFGAEDKAKKLLQKSEVGKVFMNPRPLEFDWVNSVKLSGFGDLSHDLPNSFFGFKKN